MITEFTIRPKPQNNNARICFFILLAGCAVMFSFSYAVTSYRWTFQLAAVVLLMAALVVYTRYVAPMYSYEITHDAEDTPVFVVRSRTGRNMTTLCRIDMADIRSVERQGKAEITSYKAPKGVKRYVYTPTLFPSERQWIVAQNANETSHIFIECTDEYAKTLLAYAEEARLMKAERYED